MFRGQVLLKFLFRTINGGFVAWDLAAPDYSMLPLHMADPFVNGREGLAWLFTVIKETNVWSYVPQDMPSVPSQWLLPFLGGRGNTNFQRGCFISSLSTTRKQYGHTASLRSPSSFIGGRGMSSCSRRAIADLVMPDGAT